MSQVALYTGDCLDIMRTLEAGSVDAVITDPPYGLGKRWTGGGWFQRGVYNGKVGWDGNTAQAAIDLIISWSIPTVIWGGNYYALPPSRCWLSWSKTNNVPTMADIELAWTNMDKPAREYRRPCNGWKRQHPTEKPLDLMTWVIEKYTDPGATVLDPFMGSGTTGVACVQTGRNFIGIEIDPGYAEIARQRIEKAQEQARQEALPL